MDLQIPEHPIIATANKATARLQGVIKDRHDGVNQKLTRLYRGSSVLESACGEIQHGIDECNELILLAPKLADKRLEDLGLAVAKILDNCKKPAPKVDDPAQTTIAETI